MTLAPDVYYWRAKQAKTRQSGTEIQQTLRLITAKPRGQRFPVSAIAQLAGLSRETIYQARAGRGLTKRVVSVLAPILADILDGTLTACQANPHGRTSVFRAERKVPTFGDANAFIREEMKEVRKREEYGRELVKRPWHKHF